MDCKIIMIEQSSDEWLDLRRCRITASRMADVMAKPDTKRYIKYRQEKVLELLGHKHVEETPEWAIAGKENESYALAGYEYKYDVEIEHNVFLISKKYDWLGCSPDFLTLPDYDSGGEMKIRKLYKNYRRFRRDAENYEGMAQCIPACDRHQVQGAMWLTGFKFWWYVNYYIGDDLEGGTAQKIHRVRVLRDQTLIDAMEVRCIEFMTDVYERAGVAA